MKLTNEIDRQLNIAKDIAKVLTSTQIKKQVTKFNKDMPEASTDTCELCQLFYNILKRYSTIECAGCPYTKLSNTIFNTYGCIVYSEKYYGGMSGGVRAVFNTKSSIAAYERYCMAYMIKLGKRILKQRK